MNGWENRRCQSIDLELLLKIAGDAPPLAEESLPLPEPAQLPLKIGVARDKAFCFYYQDNLELLEELGAQLVPLFPALRPAAAGIGRAAAGRRLPELYAGELSANEPLRSSLRRALAQGLPCIAECGGFQYLQQALEGEDRRPLSHGGIFKGERAFAPAACADSGMSTSPRARTTCSAEQGEGFAAHEFHYWDSEVTGDGFVAQKPLRRSHWDCVVCDEHFWGGYPHLFFYSNPQMAKNFLNRCEQYHRQKEGI